MLRESPAPEAGAAPQGRLRRDDNSLSRGIRWSAGRFGRRALATTGATYRRLIAEGHDNSYAIELITAVLAAEMYDIVNEQRDFDEAKYNANLRRLPELPYESDA